MNGAVCLALHLLTDGRRVSGEAWGSDVVATARYTGGRASGLVPHTGKTSCLHHSGDYSHAGEPDSTGPPEHSLLLLQVRL
ncbi:unnamed protein product [Boreogadus saida]